MLDEKLLSKQTFDLQSDRILLKEIIKKEFLAIEIWAINDDNPNNNYSHFVADDYSKSLPSFINKPILGYFAQGDFKAHEGKNAKDEEMDVTYWDNKEQILGFIRDKDKVEVREKEGKKWIVTTAVLWSNYNYHQIKKIIKDRRKKVSVEINVEDAYFTDLNGNMLKAIELKNDKTLIVKDEEGKELKYKYGTYIEHITQFDLSGITILGSKMGIPIKEGIEGASLSLLNEMGKALFSRQQQALSFAYQKLDGKDEGVDANINFSKEDKGEMDNQDLHVDIQNLAAENLGKLPEDVEDKGATLDEPGDEIKMKEVKEEQKQENHEQENSEADGHSEKCAEGCEDGECNCDNNCKNAEEDPEDDDHEDDDVHEDECKNCKNSAEDPVNECKNAEGELPKDNCNNCKNAEESDTDPATGVEDNCNNCKFEEGTNDDHSADGQTGNSEEDYAVLLSKYNETKAALEESQEALAAQEKKFAEQEEQMAKIKADCDNYLEVKKNYEVELEELRKAVFAMTAEKRSEQVLELMSQNGLTQEQRAAFLKKCQDGEYNNSFDDLKRDVALAYFDFNNNGTSAKRNSDDDFSVSLTSTQTPVKTTKSRKERMADYANNR